MIQSQSAPSELVLQLRPKTRPNYSHGLNYTLGVKPSLVWRSSDEVNCDWLHRRTAGVTGQADELMQTCREEEHKKTRVTAGGLR